MTNELPGPQDYVELSEHLIRQADAELEKGDHLQAGEKGWGAVAHALKAVAEQRGWNHNNHFLLQEVAMQLFTEFDSPRLAFLYDAADRMHQNFYENIMSRDDVEFRISGVKELLAELKTFRDSPPRPFVPQNHDQRRRLDRLARQP
jgi:hypothetical protein